MGSGSTFPAIFRAVARAPLPAEVKVDIARGSRRRQKGVLLGAIVVAFGGLLAQPRPMDYSTGFAPPESPARPADDAPYFDSSFVTNSDTPFAHSAALTEISGGRLRAVWKGGSKEGKPDVALYTSVYDPANPGWSDAEVAMTRESVRRDLARNIIALGNPVVMREGSGRLLMWFVSVSVGGWSGSAINMVTSDDDGATWSRVKRLVTSPFFNYSTLVKAPPIHFEDGTVGLPIYHENIGKFGELLRLTPEGEVLHKQRLTSGRQTIQPVIVPRTGDDAMAFLRRAGSAPRQCHAIYTTDGGQSWSEPVLLDKPNPGMPVAALRLETEEILFVFNDHARRRDNLTLAITADEGKTHEVLTVLDRQGDREDGVNYPTLIQTTAGHFHLLYTWHREEIKHVNFNLAWVDQQR